jgi:hypothetical protein
MNSTDKTFTLVLTDAERLAILYSLGYFWQSMSGSAASNSISLLEKRLHDAKADNEARINPASGTEAARAVLSPPPAVEVRDGQARMQITDRWQRSKAGVELPFPEGHEVFEVAITKAERKDLSDGRPRMIVGWPVPQGQGFASANCFDEKLFPWLSSRLKQKTVLYIMRSGKYLNVVGVRA